VSAHIRGRDVARYFQHARAITIVREARDLPTHRVRHGDEAVLDVELLREELVLSEAEG
jgi:hypothetical protein